MSLSDLSLLNCPKFKSVRLSPSASLRRLAGGYRVTLTLSVDGGSLATLGRAERRPHEGVGSEGQRAAPPRGGVE